MVSIKLFGTLRLKTGCKQVTAEITHVKEACDILAAKTGLSSKEFKKCVIAINGKPSNFHASLQDGDELAFFSPSGGG